jgi:hypothetical protein
LVLWLWRNNSVQWIMASILRTSEITMSNPHAR